MTLTKEEWTQVEQLVNGEYMTQVEDAGWNAVLAGVKLAMTVLQSCPIQTKSLIVVRQQALDYLTTYGYYDEAPIKDILTKQDLHTLHVKKYGSEEEAIAQERFDFIVDQLAHTTSEHVRLWHQDAQGLWHMLESYKDARGWVFYYEQGTDPEQIRIVGSTDYLSNRSINELVREVKEQKQFDVYDIPVEQWTLTPNV